MAPCESFVAVAPASVVARSEMRSRAVLRLLRGMLNGYVFQAMFFEMLLGKLKIETKMRHTVSQNDSFAAMESAGRLIRSLGNGELLKQCDMAALFKCSAQCFPRFESSRKNMSNRFAETEAHNEVSNGHDLALS